MFYQGHGGYATGKSEILADKIENQGAVWPATTTAPLICGATGTAVPAGTTIGSIKAAHSGQASSTTHLNEGTVVVTVFFISLRFVKISWPQPGIQDVQTNRFGLTQMSLSSGPVEQTISQCLQSGVLGPGTQKSSHSIAQHVVVILRSSWTSRQIFLQRFALHPQREQQPSPAVVMTGNPAQIVAPMSERSAIRRV